MLPIDYWNDYDKYAYGETDKYYYIGLNMFDKKTRMLVDEDALVSSHELYSLYLEIYHPKKKLNIPNYVYTILFIIMIIFGIVRNIL